LKLRVRHAEKNPADKNSQCQPTFRPEIKVIFITVNSSFIPFKLLIWRLESRLNPQGWKACATS